MIVTKTYQGSPCKKAGHIESYLTSSGCVACAKARLNKWIAKNPEKHRANSRKHYAENPDKKRAYQAKNKDKIKAQYKKYKVENLQYVLRLDRHKSALRRARVLRQTPPWADLDKIKSIYLSCPEGYDVDHIHPISKGGLHVHYNLQYLTEHDNRVKGAKIL